ncbi:MAG: DUF1761 domain-containing protein [Candidatus Levybacteria bacterium]|nr:DUF1761 domain-containing protein [Candidatus Levybacteria bacterium]
MEINFVAAFVASLTGLVLGYLWYSVFFAKIWEKLAGVTVAQQNKGVAKRIIGSYLITLVMSLNLAAFIGSDSDAMFGLFAGFAAGFGWVALAFGQNYMFEHKPFKLFLINGGYNTVLLSIIGLIIGLF